MDLYLDDCTKKAQEKTHTNEEMGRQDDLLAPAATLDGPDVRDTTLPDQEGVTTQEGPCSLLDVTGTHVSLTQDQVTGEVFHPRGASTPKKEDQASQSPTPAQAVRSDAGDNGVSGDGPLSDPGRPLWPMRNGKEEIAMISRIDDGHIQNDEGARDENNEICSVAGVLVEQDDGSPVPSGTGEMSSLAEVNASLNSLTDASRDNTKSIEDIRKVRSKQCVKTNIQHSKSLNELETMRKIQGASQARLSKQGQQIEALRDDNIILKMNLCELSKQVESNVSENKALREQVNILGTENKNLRVQVENLIDENKLRDKQINNVITDNESLRMMFFQLWEQLNLIKAETKC